MKNIDDEIDEEGDRDPDHVEGQGEDLLSLQAEHDEDGEKKGDKGYGEIFGMKE